MISKFSRFITTLILLIPLLTQASSFAPTVIQKDLVPNTNIAVTYTFPMAPPQTIKLYAWIGDPTKDFSQWNRNNYLGQISATDTPPFEFTKVWDISSLDSSKTYAYAFADGSGTNAVLFNKSGSANGFNCFTMSIDSVPCFPTTTTPSTNTTPAPTPTPAPTSNSNTVTNPTGVNIGNSDFDLFLTSITPTSDGANVSVLLKTKSGLDENVKFSMSVAKVTNGIVGPFQVVNSVGYTGILKSKQITGTITGLLPNTQYVYEFSELMNNSLFGGSSQETFTTLPTIVPIVNGSSSGNFQFGLNPLTNTSGQTAGACGSSVNGQSLPIVTENTIGLCSNIGMTVTGFTQTADGGGWTWFCSGINGGPTSQQCSATLSGTDGDKPGFLKNPFKGIDSFPKLFAAVVNNIILPVAVPFIAVMIIYSGFLFVIARKDGKVDTLQRAKSTFKYTMIGAALILGAFVIANALQGTLNALVQ